MNKDNIWRNFLKNLSLSVCPHITLSVDQQILSSNTNVRMRQQQAELLSLNCKGQILKPVGGIMLCFAATVLSACFPPCIPALRGSIRCLSVKVLSNSNHHKRWEQMEKNNHHWHSRDIPPKCIASVWKNVIACAQPCSEKYTNSLWQRA